jgi:hypothetical protein
VADRICPICLAPLDPRQIHWRDAVGNFAEGPPTKLGLRDRVKARLSNAPDTTAKQWADWYARGFRAYCPEHQGELPEDMFTRDLVIIGLVGESGASKTHYMASLLNLLASGVLAPYQVVVNFDPGTVMRFQNDYYRRLYMDHEVIPASRPLRWFDETAGHREVRQPMTVVLRNWQTGRAVNVCVFDAAGEQLLTREQQATWARHLSIADGLLFFVDPAILPGVPEVAVATGGGQTLHVTESVIDITAGLVRRAKSLSPDADIAGVPAALLLAKADLLVGTDGFPEEVLEPLDHLTEAPYRLVNRLRQDSVLVEQYLAEHGGVNLVGSAVHKFPGITFHAVSATGHAPRAGVYPALEPQRCLEPFLMLLARTGVIDLERVDG